MLSVAQTKKPPTTHSRAWKKRCKQLPKRRPCWEILQKSSLLFMSTQLSRTSLSGHQISWDGKWSWAWSWVHQWHSMPAFVSQRFPNFCCQMCVILPVVSPHSGPGCSAHQNSSHPTSSKLTLVSHGHMPLDVFALGVRRECVKIKPAYPLGVAQLCGGLSSPGMD